LNSSVEAFNALIKRGRDFLNSARANLERGLYDIACFEADQAVQLVLKAHIQRLGVSVPRTHSIRRLLGHLGSLTGKGDEVSDFVSRLRGELITLEDAYLRSRYAMEGYVKEDAELFIRVAEEVIEFVESIIEGC